MKVGPSNAAYRWQIDQRGFLLETYSQKWYVLKHIMEGSLFVSISLVLLVKQDMWQRIVGFANPVGETGHMAWISLVLLAKQMTRGVFRHSCWRNTSGYTKIINFKRL